jgi:spermidine/putrescine transport system ATP-binding protein
LSETDVRLERVSKTFHDVVAVDDLSLDVERGEFFSLLGSSGCGKTTTLRMVAGLEDATSGTIYLDGRDVTNLPSFKRNVNTVFQNYALFPHLNVYDNVAFGPRRQRMAEQEVRRRVGEMLELVELPGYERRRPNQLSGGQQQRVALARALINHPRVLLLDEPLGALDLKLRKQMQLELKRIQTEVGITFVYVTHDQEEAMTMSDRIAVMRAGRIEQLGTPEELYEQPRSRFVASFLGVSNLLVGTLSSIDGGRATIELDSGGRVMAPADGLAAGSKVDVGVRPEKLRLLPVSAAEPPDGDANVLEGHIRDASYVGVSTQYVVRIDAGSDVVVYAQNLETSGIGEQHSTGERVRLAWRPQHTFVVAHEASQPEEAADAAGGPAHA